jgi:hypothetical protein
MTAADLEGAWRTERYIVQGQPHHIDGVLLLTSQRWATLYFVPTAAGPWGSAEAGAFTVCDGRLTFHHEFVLQAGGERAMRLETEAGHSETCDVRLATDCCTIEFPSGNHLELRRIAP